MIKLLLETSGAWVKDVSAWLRRRQYGALTNGTLFSRDHYATSRRVYVVLGVPRKG